jgi:hypothetical protein
VTVVIIFGNAICDGEQEKAIIDGRVVADLMDGVASGGSGVKNESFLYGADSGLVSLFSRYLMDKQSEGRNERGVFTSRRRGRKMQLRRRRRRWMCFARIIDSTWNEKFANMINETCHLGKKEFYEWSGRSLCNFRINFGMS